ncbi:hypothetical protein NIES4071_27830 [Calothrix sp. NIES-4071]|nr:hypothetical protein NIES4071_27830 [Calothrix sp. NIES-4071]BAZ57105.1 hypothetical protein NIES4105_27770 [Calothrix sp. NIES-4105]
MQAATRRLDDSGIDATITVPGKINSKRLPRFDVQIKSTSQDIIFDESIKYRLTAKNYDELRENDPFVPQLLVVVLIPEDVNNWLSQTEEALCIKRCANSRYHYRDDHRLINKRLSPSKFRVKIYARPDALKIIMERIAAGENL